MDSGRGDKEHIGEGKMHTLGDDDLDSANTNSEDRGTTNATDGPWHDQVERVKVRLHVAKVDGCTTVEVEGCNGRINHSGGALLGCLICESSKINRM